MSRRAWILFAAMCLLWGVPYLLIKVAGEEVSPFVLVVTRVGIAAVILLPLAAWRGELRVLRRHPRLVLGCAFIEIAIPFTLIAYGEQHLTSSLSGLLVAAVPLFVALLAVRFDAGERVTGTRLVGLGVGFGGVLLLLGLDVGGDGQALLAGGAIMLAALSYAGGALIIKRAAALPQVGLSAVSLAIAAVALAPFAVLTAPDRLPSGTVVAALLVLAVVCTAVALVVFSTLIATAGASRATVITYVNPAVAVALGVVLLDEPVGVSTAAGFLLILAGSWLSTGGRPPSGLVRAGQAVAARLMAGHSAPNARRQAAARSASCTPVSRPRGTRWTAAATRAPS